MRTNIFKTAAMALATVFILSAVPQTAYAQLSKKQEKQLAKEKDKMVKKKLQELKSDGWKLGADSRSMEVALLEHYQRIGTGDKNIEFVGEVSKCKSQGVCEEAVVRNAQNRYATLASAYVKGKITSDIFTNANIPQEEIDKLVALYATRVEQAVGKLLTESFSLTKDNNDGTKMYRKFFILNEENAALARKKALELSLEETDITIEMSKKIFEYVDVENNCPVK